MVIVLTLGKECFNGWLVKCPASDFWIVCTSNTLEMEVRGNPKPGISSVGLMTQSMVIILAKEFLVSEVSSQWLLNCMYIKLGNMRNMEPVVGKRFPVTSFFHEYTRQNLF